ncbi:MAG TPA: 2OG-Fe(II) oxygenase [Sphingomonadaceae bacterium]|nr:2OG-Fe(II) oxygenase [Sphingomonadaceae bacterium]
MAYLTLRDEGGFLSFDEQACLAAGERLRETYRSAAPFPHIVIEDFLDRDLLRAIAGAYPSLENRAFFDRDQERFKYQIHPQESGSGLVRNLLAELNSQAFLGFLRALTGIEGLVADPYFLGGGLHETKRGGHLGVHADFNIHPGMKLERRLNLLIYLNEDWLPEYGGDLELWDRKMARCEIKVAPLIGRALIFNTALDSYHGHPDPLTCPADRSRRSIATYYYTAPEGGVTQLAQRTTNFRQRPDSQDRFDWRISLSHLIEDWTPPAVRRWRNR